MNLAPEYAMFNQRNLTCYWGIRDELSDRQRKIIKDLELALRYYDGTDLKEHNLFRCGKMFGNFI